MLIECELCPHECKIQPGHSGSCRIRVNIDGNLEAVTYGHPSAVHVDPVEKKPLNHFLPGTPILSLATVGCNLHCKNCQNWEISQKNPEESTAISLTPEEIAPLALKYNCQSVAYTYTEPLAYYEYTLDSAIKVHEANLRNVLVTAGYCKQPPLKKLFPYIDAANIDLKAMSNKFYQEICGATLKPVLDTLVLAKSMNVLVEVTNLLIPTLNDSDVEIRALCNWIRQYLGKETPVHFSRFAPRYKLRNLPPTPSETLVRARQIAQSVGLDFIYIGNIMVEDSANTYCPLCSSLLIRRKGYWVQKNRLKNGKCPQCNQDIYGVWK